MPGYVLELSCPCGFRRKDVWVGVTESPHIHLNFALCLDCHKVVFLRKKLEGEFINRCPQCGMKLVALDEPGAWEPAELQKKFPGTEPWLVDNDIYELEEEEMEYFSALSERIRILCPKCEKHSMKYEETGNWD